MNREGPPTQFLSGAQWGARPAASAEAGRPSPFERGAKARRAAGRALEGGESSEPTVEALAAARSRLHEGAAALGVSLSSPQLDRFAQYAALLRQGKRELSLTTLTEPTDVAIKHFLDSLSILAVLPPAAVRLVDVGTGAGFPGLPLKIARPELDLVLLEATAKKAAWVARTADRLGLRGVRVLAARAEDVAHDPAHRACYDVAVARAVAPLTVLGELCLPFLRPGGTFIAQKSAAGAAAELPAAHHALSVLGARLREVRLVELPDLPNRVLVVVEQIAALPPQYPRRAGMPAKRPL